jgi:uncharacterized membrane protein YqiK
VTSATVGGSVVVVVVVLVTVTWLVRRWYKKNR